MHNFTTYRVNPIATYGYPSCTRLTFIACPNLAINKDFINLG
ncbi:hypothetical protein ACFCT7_11035 [Fulvivirgaceae bacterium LMO-SS25]